VAIVALLPLFVALFWALTRSPQAAFARVWLPCLLLLPDFYHWKAPGLPDPTFHQSAILPIIGVWLLTGARGWKWSFTDLLVFGFAFSVSYSEYQAAGYKEAQNLMFDMLASVVLPYVGGKVFIEQYGLSPDFGKIFVALLAVVTVFCVYEFRMGMDPFTWILGKFFPGQGDGWVTTFRYGLARVAGPYGHAILAGMVFLSGYRLARWLEWTGSWNSPWRARVMTLAVLAGLVMTLVRGPWLGSILGAGFTMIGRAKNRKFALMVLFLTLITVGVPSGIATYRWASVGRANAKSDSQETAAYRKELIDKYMEIAAQHAGFGWGRNTWPRVEGMPSIDNYYLLLTLMHGFMALGLFLSIIAVTSWRLVADAMRRPPPAQPGGSLGFTLAGIYIGIAFSLGTVYLGTTVVPLFALLTGWSEGYLLFGAAESADGIQKEGDTAPAPALARFARVIQ
jgi:hypothetical protein